MAFAQPRFDRSEVNRAGKILCSDTFNLETVSAYDVLANWRACHGYPINTFQALLRQKLRSLDSNAIVAQRLKRAPSVVAKLQRFPSMKLAQMQDIGGLRAIVRSLEQVKQLEIAYKTASFDHELVNSKDYISSPKSDGYRSIHLVFKYQSKVAPIYNGLLLEMQFRTKLQHAWATAVETMGTFLGQALKSGQGEKSWRQFFEACSAALAHVEKTTPVPGYEHLSRHELFSLVADMESDLRVLTKLEGFSVAANRITEERGAGSYHLVVLDSSSRTVSIRPFPKTQLENANTEYARVEERAQRGEQIEAVLVSAGPIEALRKAYPNYFLDTHEFVRQINSVIRRAASGKALASALGRSRLPRAGI